MRTNPPVQGDETLEGEEQLSHPREWRKSHSTFAEGTGGSTPVSIHRTDQVRLYPVAE